MINASAAGESDSDIEDTDIVMNLETAMLVNSERKHHSRATFSSDDDSVSVSTDSLQNPDGPQKSTVFVWILAFFSAIGGFLFGYDTGVVSGAMLLLKDHFALSSFLQEVIVSVTIAAACLAALTGGFLNDIFGRKATIIVASLVFTVGAVVLGIAQNISMLVIGRLILGIGIGFASMTVPVYIAECAPAHLRGQMVTLNVLFITGGQFIASLMDGAFSYIKEDGWRYMLGLAAVPSLVQLIGFIFLPESPRWLMKKGYESRARSVLISIRGCRDIESEITSMQLACEEDEMEKQQMGNSITILRIFKTPHTRKAVIVGCGLQLFQQLTGINTIMYYSASIVKMSGVSNQHEAIWLAALTASVNFIFTIVGLWLVERIGRRRLLLGSLLGVFSSLIVLAVGFQLAAFNSPPVTVHEQGGDNSSCSSNRWCESCIENSDCGFCYDKLGSGAANGSCLAMNSDDSSHSLYGRCNTTDLKDDLYWADNFCPTSYSWIAILGLSVYLMFFAPGMGPMPWTINSEIYPLWARSTGNSLSAATNWICNLLVSMTFLTLTETLTKYGTYWLFSAIALLGLVFFFILLPETKGRRLEDVEELFSKPWCSCRNGWTKLKS